MNFEGIEDDGTQENRFVSAEEKIFKKLSLQRKTCDDEYMNFNFFIFLKERKWQGLPFVGLFRRDGDRKICCTRCPSPQQRSSLIGQIVKTNRLWGPSTW